MSGARAGVTREKVREMLVHGAGSWLELRGSLKLRSAIDEALDRAFERLVPWPTDRSCPHRRTSWSAAAPPSGTISGMPLARASAATMQNVSASQPWTSASALASKRGEFMPVGDLR